MRKTVKKVARSFPTAIVSGRRRDKVWYGKYLYKIFVIFLVEFNVVHTWQYDMIYVFCIVCFWLQVYGFVKLEELYYAGSHGMDIKGPTKDSNYTKVSELLCFIFTTHHHLTWHILFLPLLCSQFFSQY